ncbi:MAG: hypothetical protein WDA02_04205 [Saccharofermentanales bacterium]
MRRARLLLSMGRMILILAVCLSACSTGPSPETDPGTAAAETEEVYRILIAGLEARGFKVDEEDVEEDILEGQRRMLILDGGERLWPYLYEDGAEMEKDAAFITSGGLTYDNGSRALKIQWVSDPHFFKSGNMILLYVGVDQDILHALEEIMGTQFAGIRSR